MKLSQLKSKVRKIKKLNHELVSSEYSSLVGTKVKLTKKCVDWYEANGDECGIPYIEIKTIASKPTGIIKSVRYCNEDGFTFVVDIDNMEFRFGIEDIKELK